MSQVVSTILVASTRQWCLQTATRKSLHRHEFLHRYPRMIQIGQIVFYHNDHQTYHQSNNNYNPTTILRKNFSSSSSNNTGSNNNSNINSTKPPPTTTIIKDYTKLQRLEDANPERIRAIQVHPDSVGRSILPGNLVYKYYKRTGNTRKVPVELEHGYFWMMWDLQKTNNKPTVSNEQLVPEQEAQTFPLLKGVKSLSGYKTELPFFFLEGCNGKDIRSTKELVLRVLVVSSRIVSNGCGTLDIVPSGSCCCFKCCFPSSPFFHIRFPPTFVYKLINIYIYRW
jgi:hypothetical protein